MLAEAKQVFIFRLALSTEDLIPRAFLLRLSRSSSSVATYSQGSTFTTGPSSAFALLSNAVALSWSFRSLAFF